MLLLAAVAVAAFGLALWDSEPDEDAPAPQKAQSWERLTLAQVIESCRTSWLAGHWDQAPLAVAWQRQRLDWYVLEGVDPHSMRHFTCTPEGIDRGGRYVRVFHERANTDPERTIVRDVNLFVHLAALPPEPDLLALEAVQNPEDPAQGPVLMRRWSGTGDPSTQGPGAGELPLLFSRPPASLGSTVQAGLKPLQANNWLRQPQDVFALLGDHVPADRRIAAMRVDDKRIDLAIVGPVKAFDGKPPAPFGDASFDEYGVRDTDWWYPRESATNGCTKGYSLAEVKALYAQAINRDRPDVWSAAFGCDSRDGGSGPGRWTLRVPRRR